MNITFRESVDTAHLLCAITGKFMGCNSVGKFLISKFVDVLKQEGYNERDPY